MTGDRLADGSINGTRPANGTISGSATGGSFVDGSLADGTYADDFSMSEYLAELEEYERSQKADGTMGSGSADGTSLNFDDEEAWAANMPDFL